MAKATKKATTKKNPKKTATKKATKKKTTQKKVTRVTIAISGANSLRIEGQIGRTVASVRKALETILNIASESSPMVNGKPAGDRKKVQQGDRLEFVKESGEKG